METKITKPENRFMSEPVIQLELYLIRHAQSRGNAGETPEDAAVAEIHDPPLSERGLRQAEMLGEGFSDTDFDAVYASFLQRTVMTARGLLSRQPGEKPLFLMPILSERGIPPEFEAKTVEQLRDIVPLCRLADGFSPDEPRVIADAGAADKTVLDRAAAVLEYFRTRFRNGEKVAVVSHAAFLTHVVFYLFGIRDVMPDFDIDFNNAGVTKVTFYEPGTNPYGDTVFAYINNTAHLREE